METLHKQIARAHRRLILRSLLGKLPWCLLGSLTLAAAAIAAGKFIPTVDPSVWALAWIGGAVGVGVLAALVWTRLAGQDALTAAVEIDRRFGLKERVSSSLALGPAELDTPIAQALVRDAVDRVGRIDVAEKFTIRPGARALWPLLPAAAALILALVAPGPASQAPAAIKTDDAAQIKKSAQSLAKKIDEKRKQAEEAGLKETDALLAQLEQDAKLLAERGSDRKQSLVALNELVKNAEKRREQVAGASELRQQLAQLKNLGEGPGKKLAQALKGGDLQKALGELDKLKEQLAAEKMDPKEQRELAKQLGEVKQAVEKITEAHRKAQDELKQEIEQQRKTGNVAEADKLQQQLDKLAEKAPQVERLSRLAEHLGKASECASSGECQQAAEALEQLSNELAGMQKELDELEMLDEALDQVAQAKNAMACKECEGEGCAACQGDGEGELKPFWMRQDFAKGKGVGAGARDERKNDTNFYDSQVKQNVRKGATVVVGTADGPNRKGQVQQEIKGEFAGGEQQAAEALSGQRLPHDYRDHAKKYFDSLREGQK